MTLKKVFLICAIVSLSLAALTGIGALLGLRLWTNTFENVIMTTLSVAYFSITSLVCAIVMEKYRLLWFTWTGIIISLIALAYTLFYIWYPFFDGILPGNYDERFLGFSFLFPYYFAHVSLLFKSLRLGHWSKRSRWTSFISVTIFTLLVIGMIFNIYDVFDNFLGFDNEEIAFRFIGVFAILTICSSVLMLIFLKIESIHRLENVTSTTLKVKLECPRCKLSQVLPVGNQRCCKCKLKIKLEIEEPVCPKCGYIQYRLVGTHCPECGIEIPEKDRWLAQSAAEQNNFETNPDNNNEGG